MNHSDDPKRNPHVTRTLLRKGAKFDFELLTLASADGAPLTREIIRHRGSVVILPILEVPGKAAQVVFIRNFRPSCESWLLELPAGTLEPGEDPGVCAGRELEEETGYKAATLTPLTRFHTSPGMTDELMGAYLATGLTPVGQSLEADERILPVPIPASECFSLILKGDLADGKSMLTLLLAARMGLISIE
ncbi:MAG: NUDIX hydrolase [Phycisphaerales bacterium]|nr:NUDIX hydrolase [Phycisphaerales bacterium]